MGFKKADLQTTQEITRLQGLLAQCYRLAGADPDGNEDWQLAENAVKEVTRMRKEYDELQWMYDGLQ